MTARFSTWLLANKPSSLDGGQRRGRLADGGGPFFALLPDELVLRILALLPLRDIFSHVMLLGDRRMSRICHDPKIWAHIHVEMEWGTRMACKILLKAGANLKELTMAVGGERGEILTTMALVNSPGLERLTCEQGVLSAALMKAIGKSDALRAISFISKMPSRLSCYMHSYIPPALLSANVSHLGNITYLNMAWLPVYHYDGADWVRTLADACGHHLERVILPGSIRSVLSDQVLNHFLERTRGTLKTLDLFSNILTASSICNLKRCESLEELFLDDVRQIGRESLNIIVELSAKLRSLGLSGGQISGQDFSTAFARKMMSLVNLRLMESRWLDDASVAVIARSCPNLKRLHLHDCHAIGDRGIGSILRTCKKLIHLMLQNIGITAKGFVRGYISSSSNLRSLSIGGDHELLAAMLKMLPKLYCTDIMEY